MIKVITTLSCVLAMSCNLNEEKLAPVAFLFMEEGAFAAQAGILASDNPYEPGTERGRRWLSGWLEAQAPAKQV